jgi:hypothetical protein
MMPGKSKHAKGKRYQQIKKVNNVQRQNTAAASAPAAAAAAPKATAPVQMKQAGKPAGATANAIANQYAYIPGDLRHIGILTGIIVVILIVLYFILH